MRTLNIPMTRAAYDRLSLLASREPLPFPLDEAMMLPFGIRTEYFADKPRITVTHEGARVAVVGPYDAREPRGMELRVFAAPSHIVDGALALLFERMEGPLRESQKLITERERTEEARRLADLRDAQATRRAVIPQDLTAQRSFFELIAASGEVEDLIPLITEDDLRYAEMTPLAGGVSIRRSSFAGFHISAATDRARIMRSFKVRAAPVAGMARLEQEDEPAVDPQRLAGLVLDAAARARDVCRPERFEAAMSALPEPEFTLPFRSFSGIDQKAITVELTPGWSLRMMGNTLFVHAGDVRVISLSRNMGSDPFEHPRSHLAIGGIPELVRDDNLDRLCSVWTREMGPRVGLRIDDYRIPDQARLERSAELMGGGYQAF